MLKTPQHIIAESIMFLEQPRYCFLPSSRKPATNLLGKDTLHRKRISYMSRGKSKSVGLYPAVLAQKISQEK